MADLEESRALLTEIRHQIHQNPELSLMEVATAALVAKRLQEWGYEVTRGIGGHGVVGRLKIGDGTRSVSLRADMDALPITESTGVAHASRNPGVMRVPIEPGEVGDLPEVLNENGELRTLPSHLPAAEPRLSGLDGFFAARLLRRG